MSFNENPKNVSIPANATVSPPIASTDCQTPALLEPLNAAIGCRTGQNLILCRMSR